MKATNYHEERLLEKAEKMIPRSIGKSVTVRSDKLPRNVKVSGIIVAAEPARFHYTARSVALLFRVTVEAGLNKTRHVFTLSRLPQ